MWLDLLLIIPCIFATVIQDNNSSHYECETNFNCTKILANSRCFNKKCICPFGYELNGCRLEENELRYRRQINYGKVNWSLFF
jgi:hypothetical protein